MRIISVGEEPRERRALDRSYEIIVLHQKGRRTTKYEVESPSCSRYDTYAQGPDVSTKH